MSIAIITSIAVTAILFEIALRSLVPPGQEPAGPFHTPELRTKVNQYESTPSFDLMITGSSIAAVNYNSVEVARVANEQGKPLSVFNAGIRGCNFIGITPVIEQFFFNKSRPETLLIVVSPTDLSETNVSRHRRSINYIKGITPEPIKRSLLTLASDKFWLYGFRKETVEFAKTLKWRYENLVEELGYVNMGSTPRNWRKPQLQFDIDGSASRAFVKLIREAKDENVNVVLLPSMGSPEFRERVTEQERSEFLELLKMVSDESDVMLLDELTPNEPTQYIDSVHLATESARIESEALAKELHSLQVI